MTFAEPLFLLLLAFPLAAILPIWRRRTSSSLPSRIQKLTTSPRSTKSDRQPVVSGELASLGKQHPTITSKLTTDHSPLITPRLLLAITLAVVALARPQWGTIDEPAFSQAREILVALDLSRSMNAPDVTPSRIERARLLTRNLLDALKGERVGLVVFSGTAFLQAPLSSDYEILREFLPDLKPGFLPEGGTNYGPLIETSLEAFSHDGGAERFLIVLSDGEATDDDWRTHVADLKSRGIHVIGLGIGTGGGAMIPDDAGGFVKDASGAVVMSRLEPATLRELANKTDGLYADAAGWIEVPRLVQQLVERGAKGKFAETTRQRRIERFALFLAPALALALWSLFSEFPITLRPSRGELVEPPRPPFAPSRPRVSAPPQPQSPVPGPHSSRSGQHPVTSGQLASLGRDKSKFALYLTTDHSPLITLLASPSLPTSFVLLASLVSPASLIADGDSSSAAPITALTRQLSQQTDVSPKDWERFANMTLDYARRRRESKEDVSTQAIRDALAAVATGESIAPTAAPWPDLREKLGQYLKPTLTPPPQPSPSPSPKDQNQNPDGSNTPSPQPSQGSQPPSPSPPGVSLSNPSPPPTPHSQNSPQSPIPSPNPPTQKVGGTSKPPIPADAAQALARQKLEQLRNQDKPLELLQQLNPEQQPPREKTGKDW